LQNPTSDLSLQASDNRRFLTSTTSPKINAQKSTSLSEFSTSIFFCVSTRLPSDTRLYKPALFVIVEKRFGGKGQSNMMIKFHQRRPIVLSILLVLLLWDNFVNAQLVEQDDSGRVSIRGEEDDRSHNDDNSRGNDDEEDNEKVNEIITVEDTVGNVAAGNDQSVAATIGPSIQNAWIHYFDAADDTNVEDMKRESGALEDADIQGPKEYIIVYKQPSDFGIAEEILADTDAAVQSTVVENGGSITYEYNAALNGVSATLTNEAMEELMKQDGIDFIEEVVPMYTTTTWGQDRVDEKDLTSGNLSYIWKRNRSAGAGVNVCVRCLSTENLVVNKGLLNLSSAIVTTDYRYWSRRDLFTIFATQSRGRHKFH
jgi:hypothetical protein